MAQKASRRPPAEARVRAQLGFVVDKAALGQTGFPRVLQFFPANITVLWLSMYQLEDVAAGQRQSHHIDMLNEVTATRSKSK
jgi:hypothetical protein